MNDYKGIHCHIVWHNEDPQYFYISFGEYDYEKEPETDSYGVADDDVFYYFDKTEQSALLEAIGVGGSKGTFQVDDTWYIDLVMPYELEPV